MNAAPLMQRILSDAALPVWHNAPEEVKSLQPHLLAICQKYQVRLSDVALRFAMDHPDIATTIVGMCDMKTIRENVSAVDFIIPDGLLFELEQVIAPVKNRMWFEGRPENNIARKH